MITEEDVFDYMTGFKDGISCHSTTGGCDAYRMGWEAGQKRRSEVLCDAESIARRAARIAEECVMLKGGDDA